MLTEAKYINLSLHYLEQVIVALAEKHRTHVPYRNSMMTSVLRDSLGGNCMTTMIAACSAERKNLDETISTCRFAQRVALIKNDALINEELDPKLIINRLKREVEELKNQLTLGKGDVDTSELTTNEIEKLKSLTQRFLDDRDIDAPCLNVGADMRKINFCFKLLKDLYHSQSSGKSQKPTTQANSGSNGIGQMHPNITIVDASHYDSKETKELKETLKQRDNEISQSFFLCYAFKRFKRLNRFCHQGILVNMLKKEKKKVADTLMGKPGAYATTVLDNSINEEAFHQPKRQICKLIGIFNNLNPINVYFSII